MGPALVARQSPLALFWLALVAQLLPQCVDLALHGAVAHAAEGHDRGAFVTTPVAYKGKVYSVSGVQSRQAGMVTCLDPVTGTTHWEGKLTQDRKEFFSSPVIADGKLYHARIDGKVFVAQIEPDFKVLSVNDMDEPIIAAPVPVGNHILIRGADTLFCVAPPK